MGEKGMESQSTGMGAPGQGDPNTPGLSNSDRDNGGWTDGGSGGGQSGGEAGWGEGGPGGGQGEGGPGGGRHPASLLLPYADALRVGLRV